MEPNDKQSFMTEPPFLTGEELKPETPRIFEATSEEAEKYKNLLIQVRIDPSKRIPEPETLLALNDTPILWRGCKSFVCSVAKARKTTTFTLFASILMGKDETANGFVAKRGCKVLFVDTEQANYDTQRIVERVASLCDVSAETQKQRFWVLNLSQYNYQEIRGIMETAIIEFKPDVLFLDNWTDCVEGVLDERECTRFSKDLRAIAQRYNLGIFSVIHANEGTSHDSTPRFRGWAIEEARKSDLTLYLKDMSESPVDELRGEYSRARFGKCRGKKPDDFGVAINDQGLPYIYSHKAEVSKPDKYADVLALVPQSGIGNTDLARRIKALKEYTSLQSGKRLIKTLVDLGLLSKRGEGKNTRYYKPQNTQNTPELFNDDLNNL